MIGQSIAHYRVTAKLGAGGMGEVYRATDSKLGRDVALKVLPPAFAQDAQRMQRFQREAQLLASLNHPNIAAIYGLEEGGSGPGAASRASTALVMELVEGPTLAERIAQGALPLDEALPIAKQIAEALEYAHEKGIIHRDLKPANIKLTKDGQVKVLDFGLAKALTDDAVATDISSSPTLSVAATKMGIILGTAAYMSPEQAKGKSVDRRADVWSFGVVLYEMLTGQALYAGETASETMAAVIMKEPDLAALPADVSSLIRHLLRRCLTRDPAERLQAIGEARIALKNPGASTMEPAAAPQAAAIRAGRVSPVAAAVGALALALVAGALAWNWKPNSPAIPLRKFEILVDQLIQGRASPPKVSPDGTYILYSTENALWVRDLASLESRKLVDGVRGRYVFWSPDSRLAGYVAEGKLWKVSAAGGQPQVIGALPGTIGQGGALDWGPDDKITLAQGMPGTGILEVSAQGGDFKAILNPKEGTEQDFHDPHWLPDGRGFLYVIDRGQRIAETIAVFTKGQTKEILRVKGDEVRWPVYSPSGHILFRRVMTNPGIWAVAFSLSRLEVTSEPFLVAANAATPSVSQDGTLAYVHDAGAGPRQLVWVDLQGKIIGKIGEPLPGLLDPRLSPDGRLIAAAVDGDIWVLDPSRNTRARLTFDDRRENTNPAWSPDGKQVVYAGLDETTANAIFMKPADGSGTARKVALGATPAVSPDGSLLAHSVRSTKTANDLWITPLNEVPKPFPFLETTGTDIGPQVSPNGRFLIYQSNEAGSFQIYAKPFPSGEGKWQISATGGTFPRWSPAGDKIVYLAEGRQFMEVSVTFQPTFAAGTPRPLFTRADTVFVGGGYDISRDGKRLLLVQETAPTTAKITVVQNWFAEFKDKQKK